MGTLHVVPLKVDTCNLPLVAVAAQITFPAPSLVQLGSDWTVPARLVHAPQVAPLNSLTMTVDRLLRTAHATWLVETSAHEGMPIPVAVPVEMKLPQLAHAAGHSAGQRVRIRTHTMFRFI